MSSALLYCCCLHQNFTLIRNDDYFYGSGQKQVYLVRLGPKTGSLKSSQKRTLRALLGPKRIVPVFGRIKPRYTRVCLLCLTFNCFSSFLSQSKRPSIVPPYAPHTNADLRGDHLHPPHPTPLNHAIYDPDTYNICLHTSAEIHRYDIRIPICTMATDGSRLPHPKSSMLDLCYDAGNSCGRREAAKQADTCVARVALSLIHI